MAGRENQVWALWLCANCLESSKRRCLPTMQTAGGQWELRGCRYADRAKHGGVCLLNFTNGETKKAPIFSGVFFMNFDLLTFAKLDTSNVELHLLG